MSISQEQNLKHPMYSCRKLVVYLAITHVFSLSGLYRAFLHSIRQLWKKINFFLEAMHLFLVLWQHEAQASRPLFIAIRQGGLSNDILIKCLIN